MFHIVLDQRRRFLFLQLVFFCELFFLPQFTTEHNKEIIDQRSRKREKNVSRFLCVFNSFVCSRLVFFLPLNILDAEKTNT